MPGKKKKSKKPLSGGEFDVHFAMGSLQFSAKDPARQLARFLAVVGGALNGLGFIEVGSVLILSMAAVIKLL